MTNARKNVTTSVDVTEAGCVTSPVSVTEESSVHAKDECGINHFFSLSKSFWLQTPKPEIFRNAARNVAIVTEALSLMHVIHALTDASD